tara:strand:- start:6753 stop:7478 length:726 start_codon:yes stop_codon:yes gene_type:complete
MKIFFKYIITFILFSITGLIIFDKMILPVIVNKNANIYLPDYRGLDYRLVEDKLDSLGFISQVIFHDFSYNHNPNDVIKMSPRPFSKLKTGRIIKLTVAGEKKDLILDDFTGLTYRNANLSIKRLGLVIDTLIYEYSNDFKKNVIISQYPRSGKILKSNDKITLILSLGTPPNYYVTPNLINLNLNKAKETISKAGLLLGKITYEYNSDYLNNTVLEQNKTAGMRLSFPTKIDLIVSTDVK